MSEKNVGEGTAKVADVLVKGLPGDPISDVDVVITLSGDDTFNEIEATVDVSDWFTNWPDTNLFAKVKEYVELGATSVTITVSGTVSQWNANALAITILGDFVESGEDIPVAENPNARYDIAMRITSITEFATFAGLVNGGKLTLSGNLQTNLTVPPDATYVPIARDYHKSYQGDFNGNGHTIDLALEGSGSYLAMFGVNNGYIHNFTVTGYVTLVEGTDPADYAAVVVAYNDINGTIEKVVSKANLTAEPAEGQSNIAHNVAGLAGFNGWDHYNPDSPHAEDKEDYKAGGTISQCRNEGNITGGFNKIGGIAGENAYIVKECVNTGIITCDKAAFDRGWPGVGGIVGRNGNNNPATEEGQILNCYNRGRINDNAATGAGQNAYGGITGWCDVVSNVKNCYTSGLIYQKDAPAKSGSVNPIIGTFDTDPPNTGNNYARDDIFASSDDVELAGIKKSDAEMKDPAFVNALNTSSGGPYVPVTDDYPKLDWE
jgi:hypothetical protein